MGTYSKFWLVFLGAVAFWPVKAAAVTYMPEFAANIPEAGWAAIQAAFSGLAVRFGPANDSAPPTDRNDTHA